MDLSCSYFQSFKTSLKSLLIESALNDALPEAPAHHLTLQLPQGLIIG